MKKKHLLIICIVVLAGCFCFSCTCSKSEKEAAEAQKPSAEEIAKQEAEKKAVAKNILQDTFFVTGSPDTKSFETKEEALEYYESRTGLMAEGLKYMEDNPPLTWEEIGISEQKARDLHKRFSETSARYKEAIQLELMTYIKRWRELRPYADEKEQIEGKIVEALNGMFDPEDLKITEEELEYIRERR
jgi:hypothetical protein